MAYCNCNGNDGGGIFRYFNRNCHSGKMAPSQGSSCAKTKVTTTKTAMTTTTTDNNNNSNATDSTINGGCKRVFVCVRMRGKNERCYCCSRCENLCAASFWALMPFHFFARIVFVFFLTHLNALGNFAVPTHIANTFSLDFSIAAIIVVVYFKEIRKCVGH